MVCSTPKYAGDSTAITSPGLATARSASGQRLGGPDRGAHVVLAERDPDLVGPPRDLAGAA